MSKVRSIVVLAACAAVMAACSVTAPPTPTPTARPTTTDGPATTTAPPPTVPPTPTTSPKATSAVSPIDGAYLANFTKEQLAASPLLVGGELNDGNWGTWTLVFDKGEMSYWQGNETGISESSGTFAVDGDTVRMNFVRGANNGETFAFRWQLDGVNLTFQRDETLGPGPTPFLVTPWTKTGTATTIPLGGGGPTLFPGTYSTSLGPPMTITVGHEVDLDCVPGYVCRGDVDANLPFWNEFEFGNDHGSFLTILSLDKVLKPGSLEQLMELPDNFGEWLKEQPQFTFVAPPHAVTIGGFQGQEADLNPVGEEGIPLYPTYFPDPPAIGIGQGKDKPLRIDWLRVGDHEIVIERGAGPEHKFGSFESAVDGLQAVVDSIAFPSSGATGQIVFEDVGDNYVGTQIWIENADGSNPRKLVSDHLTDNAVSLSPDGSQAVYYSTSDPNGLGRIMIVEVASGATHELDTGGAALGCDQGPEGDAWSPDGKRIAFARFCFGKAGTFTGGGIWTINSDGTDPIQVTHVLPTDKFEDHRASWSPDGSRLVFARTDTSGATERSAIFSVATDGSDLEQVTPWDLDANDPDWSPDGSLIAFNAPAEAPAPDQNIFVVAPDGSGLVQLTHGLPPWPDGGQATYHPTWSPSGSQILFSHAPATHGFADLYVMNRDGSDQHALAATTLAENHATWGGGK